MDLDEGTAGGAIGAGAGAVGALGRDEGGDRDQAGIGH